MVEKARIRALFTHRSVANSGKSAGGATEIHAQRITAKGSENAPNPCVHTGFASTGTRKRYLARLGPHTGDPVRCAEYSPQSTHSSMF